ncbi:MAG: ParA family protein [Promethearchaeia archaeon]
MTNPKHAQIISIVNWKGGVGKTTCAVNLAGEWAFIGKKVLLIDIDAQASASAYIYTESKYQQEYYDPILKALKSRKEEDVAKKIAINKSIFGIFWDAIKEDNQFSKEDGIKRSLCDLIYLDLIPSTFYINELEQEITSASSTQGISPFNVLREGLIDHNIVKEYDIILIDCPPNLNLVTLNAIFTSDFFIIPTIPDQLSTLGLPLLIRRLQTVKKRRLKFDSHAPKFLGVIITRESHQLRGIQKQWIENHIPWMIKRFKEEGLIWENSKVFESIIKERADIQKALEESKPLCASKFKNKESRIFFQNLAKEILQSMNYE